MSWRKGLLLKDEGSHFLVLGHVTDRMTATCAGLLHSHVVRKSCLVELSSKKAACVGTSTANCKLGSEGRARVIHGRAIEVSLVEIDTGKVKLLVRGRSIDTSTRGTQTDAPPCPCPSSGQ